MWSKSDIQLIIGLLIFLVVFIGIGPFLAWAIPFLGPLLLIYLAVIFFEGLFSSKDSKKQNTKQNNNTNDDCFVVTATMGDPYHPVVLEYRKFRDARLTKTVPGKMFIAAYYRIGPLMASVLNRYTFLKPISYYLIVYPVYKLIAGKFV